LLFILLKGTNGEAYNGANEETYISSKGMAEFLKANFNSNIHIKIELGNNFGYAPVTKLRLSSEKLRILGWKPKYGLYEIFSNLIKYLIVNES
jgi:nucleoside-diphosphate-sugar epimerase